MRLVSYIPRSADPKSCSRIAGVRDDGLVDLHDANPEIPQRMKAFLKGGQAMMDAAREAIQKGKAFPADEAKILAPLPKPGKIICIGLNYADHAAETGTPIPEEPVVFNKFVTAVRADGETVQLPPVSDRVDYEAELVVIFGREGKNIAEEDALGYVAGYCCGNDISARDWQKGKPAKQWLLGKSFDTFAPFGPELVTADEVGDPGDLRVQLRRNGETMQDSRTNRLIFSVPKLIAYISQVATIKPGDVLFTGTPPGVGDARTPPVYLQPGDKLEVEIERIGVLHNTVE